MSEELESINQIDKLTIAKSLTYETYFQLINELLQVGKTTGQHQDEKYVQHARLNFQRMKRVYRKTQINDDLKNALKNIHEKQMWIVLSEGWCGDAAQSLPALAKLAELYENIELRILLRDENLEIMDSYLTNGSRSIPKLIVLDANTFKNIFTWGPRPKKFQELVLNHKQNPVSSDEVFNEHLHKEYTLDKTQSLQKEIHQLIIGV